MEDHKGKFLIADDEPDMCWALELILRRGGWLTERALSGREVCLRIQAEKFRLLFLDAKLPDVEGLDLARRIREMNPEMPIILVSGYFYKDDAAIRKALAEGWICGFISKPFLHEEILRAVKTACP